MIVKTDRNTRELNVGSPIFSAYDSDGQIMIRYIGTDSAMPGIETMIEVTFSRKESEQVLALARQIFRHRGMEKSEGQP